MVGRTDHGSSRLTGGVEQTNLFIAPAILRIRPSGGITVTISWPTDDERISVSPDGKMSFRGGEQVLVLISTISSTSGGCANGHAVIEAIQTSPGTWCRNLV